MEYEVPLPLLEADRSARQRHKSNKLCYKQSCKVHKELHSKLSFKKTTSNVRCDEKLNQKASEQYREECATKTSAVKVTRTNHFPHHL